MGGSACFQLPTDTLQTRDGMPSRLGCGAFVNRPANGPVNVSGNVHTFGTNKPVPGADVKLYGAPDYATPIAMATSLADATWSLQVPVGTPNELYGLWAATGYLSVYTYNIRLDWRQGDVTQFNVQVVTPENIEAAGILVKENWDPAEMVVLGTALDCNGVIVEHAAIVASSTPGQRDFAPRVTVYYGAPGAVPLAVTPQDRGDTNDNGAFALFHIESEAPIYVQMWGFVDAAAMAQGEAGLTLVAEQSIHPIVNNAGSLNLWTK
jgi:hypothetical protein